MIRHFITEIWASSYFVISDLLIDLRSYIKISQKAFISVIWCRIKKIMALYFLQLWKLEKQKCFYFQDQSSSWWVMVILLFHEGAGKLITSHKTTKSSYLPHMTSGPKNEGTSFSSTFKVEEKKVLLFFLFKVNRLRYSDFDFWQNLPFLDHYL